MSLRRPFILYEQLRADLLRPAQGSSQSLPGSQLSESRSICPWGERLDRLSLGLRIGFQDAGVGEIEERLLDGGDKHIAQDCGDEVSVQAIDLTSDEADFKIGIVEGDRAPLSAGGYGGPS